MIAVSTPVYDLNGSRIFRHTDDQKNRSGKRRIVRTKTLDGGVEIYDSGYTDADRDLVMELDRYTPDDVDFVRYIVSNYAEVIVGVEDGFFRCAPDSFSAANQKLVARFLIKEVV